MKNCNAKRAIDKVAEAAGVSPEEIRVQIEFAVREGMLSADPDVQRRWAAIPKKGLTPTPEEVIAFLAAEVDKRASFD